MADVVSNANAGIVNSITSVHWMYILGWVFAGLLLVGGAIWAYLWWKDKRLYSKFITAFDTVGGYYQPAIKDKARVVKIGSGGFEILLLKKAKIYKIAYGGRIGKDTYYFFISPDGYWYNSMLSGKIQAINAAGGLIPVVTTNPSMRAQYTSLEKQIDSLHAAKTSWMDKYGGYAMAIGFVIIAGFLLYLNYQEYVKSTANLSIFADKLGLLVDKMNQMLGNVGAAGSGGNGLVPVK